MSKVYVTSDLHLGHKNIYKYREEFTSMEEHDSYIFSKIMELRKQDILLVIGDFLFDGSHYNEYIERLSKKKCRIKLIMGNHDSKKLYNEGIIEMQLPLYQKKNIWLSHCPIHPDEMRGRKGNIHGHLHKEVVKKDAIQLKYGGLITENIKVPDTRYFNANIDVNNYEFLDFKEIEEYFKD